MIAFLLDLWRHRGLRMTFWIFTTLLSFSLLTTWTLNWSGEKRWQSVKTRLEAKGETFDILKLLPPPVPDERNFAAIELLRNIRLPEGDSESLTSGTDRRNDFKKACSFLDNPKLMAAMYKDIFGKAQPPDLKAVIAAIRENKLLPWPEQAGDSAAALRIALEQHEPLLLELGKAASVRLESEFVPRWDHESLPDIWVKTPIEHHAFMTSFARMLQLHGMACIHAGDGLAAMHDVQAILRLSQSVMKEPLLISQLTGNTLLFQALELVWQMLEQRCSLETTLSLVQTELEKLRLDESLLRTTRGELAAAVNCTTYLENHPKERAHLWMSGLGAPPPPSFSTSAMACIPAGFLMHNKASLVNMGHQFFVHPMLISGLQNVSAENRRADIFLRGLAYLKRPDCLIARSILPIFFIVREQTVFADNLVRQARLACALELHFLEHLSFPPKLEELNATHLAGASLLAVDGNPMHYKVNGLGRYWLWSDGPDGVNDGGMMRTEKKTRGASRSLTARNYEGDWVWRYEPVKQ